MMALWEIAPVGVLVFLIYGGILALILVCLIRLAKFLISVPNEQKLLRFELGKLAEEVHQIHEEMKTNPSKKD